MIPMKILTEEETYVVAPATFFSPVGENVYVRNVDTQRDFLFAGNLGDILSALKHPMTAADLDEHLKKRFSLPDGAEFQNSLADLLNDLSTSGIIEKQHPSPAHENPAAVMDRVRSACAKTRRLWSVVLELTYRCNERCVHCYLDNPKECNPATELGLSDWMRIVDECAGQGCLNYLVTGGEPSLHPAFLPLCEHIVNRGLLLDIYTNGLSLPRSAFLSLRKLKFNSISVSLYGGTAAFHDSITRTPGSFEKTLSTAMMFKCAGKNVFVKSVVFADHVDEFFDLKAFCRHLGLEAEPAPLLLPGHSGASKTRWMLSPDEYRLLIRRLAEDIPPSAHVPPVPAEAVVPDRPVCGAGQCMLSFNPRGQVFACNALPVPVGDACKSSVAEIWNHSQTLGHIRSLRFRDICPRNEACPWSQSCTLCLGAIPTTDTQSPSRPPAWLCAMSRIRHEEAVPFCTRECGA